jgi:hypothetical protein
VYKAGEAAVWPVTDAAAQLTGLRQLELLELPWIKHPALQKLTALTALEQLSLRASGDKTATKHCRTRQVQTHLVREAPKSP